MRLLPYPRFFARVATFALVALAACHSAPLAGTGEPVPTVPPPAELLLEVSLPRLEGGLAGVAAYADHVKPGTGGLVSSQSMQALHSLMGVSSLDGARADAPAVLLVRSPKAGPPQALLVAVADEAKLRKSAAGIAIRIEGGHALLGPQAAVDALAPYAFGWVARKAAPAAPIAIVHVPALLAAYRQDLMNGLEQMKTAMASTPGTASMGDIFDAEVSGFVALLEQSSAIEIRLEASADDAGIDLALVPKPGTSLASFVALQKPASDRLLRKLPAMKSTAFAAVGELHLGSLRASFQPFIEQIMARFLSVPLDDKIRAGLNAWFDAFTGEIAIVGDIAPEGMQFVELAGASDGSKAAQASRSLFASLVGAGEHTLDNFGVKSVYTGIPDAGTHDGVALSGYRVKVDLSSLPPASAKSYPFKNGMVTTFAGWDDVFGVAVGPTTDSAKVMGSVIDASRGKAPRLELATGLRALLDSSRARGESFAMVMNLSGVMASFAKVPAPAARSGLVFAFGFQGGRAHMRVALPAEHLLEIIAVTAGK